MKGSVAMGEQPLGHVGGGQVNSSDSDTRVRHLEHQMVPAAVATPVTTS